MLSRFAIKNDVPVLRNYLVNIDANLVTSLPHLEVLDISHNFIISLEERFFNSLEGRPSLLSLHIQGEVFSIALKYRISWILPCIE
jgi:hypothetical protein